MSEKTVHDPFSPREAEHYDNPIPSREFILEILKQNDRPLTRRQIGKLLALTGEDQTAALRRRLRAMARDAP